MRRKVSFFTGSVLIIISCIFLCFSSDSKAVHIEVKGCFYDSGGEGIEGPCEIAVDGDYYTSFLRKDIFAGRIVVDSDPAKIDVNIAELCFSDNIAVPITEDELGYQYTSKIHSIIRVNFPSEFVIVLYNEYSVSGGKLIASIDKTSPIFICVGKISKQEAIDLIYSYYE